MYKRINKKRKKEERNKVKLITVTVKCVHHYNKLWLISYNSALYRPGKPSTWPDTWMQYIVNSGCFSFCYYSKQVTKKGTIIDEKTYRLNMAKKEHRKHVRDLLATAIVHKTLDIEVK